MTKLNSLFACLALITQMACGQSSTSPDNAAPAHIIPGAERTDVYLPLLKGKKVAIFANHTSTVGNQNLVDTLHALGVNITVIFGPEHGFRGTADAGAKVGNSTDPATGIPVVSLYGKKRKPTLEDLAGADIMIFDIQDVGTRFYTYISSMQEYMEAALELKKPLIILDRPNPNGFYVDGPILDTAFRSFVGMQPIPIVYGLTMGEYARMLGGEQWLSPQANATYAYYQTAKATPDTAIHFLVVKCANYTHKSKYVLPVKPSPNLPNIQSIYLYPSTCFFEGTVLSEGRGTDKPFQIWGHPDLPATMDSFTPHGMPGATNPKLKDQLCYGRDLSGTPQQVLKEVDNKLQLKWIMEAYRLFPDKEHFFIGKASHFNRLAGNEELIEQIKNGVSEASIRQSWEPALSQYKQIRKKYLLYEDF